MTKWTSCQYDGSQNLLSISSVEGGMNPRRQAILRSQEYERDHKGCPALEVEGGFENCPIGVLPEIVDEYHFMRGK
jgi:hypothetical protein